MLYFVQPTPSFDIFQRICLRLPQGRLFFITIGKSPNIRYHTGIIFSSKAHHIMSNQFNTHMYLYLVEHKKPTSSQ